MDVSFSQLHASSQRLDVLQTLDKFFEQTRMLSGTTNFDDLETSFASMRDAGAPIYISFRDLFFRIFMHMVLQMIHFNGVTKSFESDWNAENLDADNDWVAYYKRIRQTGAIYMALETSRRAQESIVSADYHHAVAHSVAPSGAALACATVGTRDSMLRIVQPANARQHAPYRAASQHHYHADLRGCACHRVSMSCQKRVRENVCDRH